MKAELNYSLLIWAVSSPSSILMLIIIYLLFIVTIIIVVFCIVVIIFIINNNKSSSSSPLPALLLEAVLFAVLKHTSKLLLLGRNFNTFPWQLSDTWNIRIRRKLKAFRKYRLNFEFWKSSLQILPYISLFSYFWIQMPLLTTDL